MIKIYQYNPPKAAEHNIHTTNHMKLQISPGVLRPVSCNRAAAKIVSCSVSLVSRTGQDKQSQHSTHNESASTEPIARMFRQLKRAILASGAGPNRISRLQN